MIKLLAEFFRAVHYIVGISLPPAGTSDRTFVFAWLGSIVALAAVGLMCVILFVHIIPLLYIRH